MWIYPTKEWKILLHIFLTPNMDWNPSILNFPKSKYSEYDK